MRPLCRKQFWQLPFSFCVVLICSASTPTLLLAEVKWLKMNSWGQEWEGGIFYCFINKRDFFSSKLGTYMLNFVRTCSTSWERHDFSLQNPGRVSYFGLSGENGSEELWDIPRLATQGILQGWVSEWRAVAGDTTQRLRMLVTLSEDWTLVPHIHIRWPTTACNSSCRDFQHSLLGSTGTCTHAQTCRHI